MAKRIMYIVVLTMLSAIVLTGCGRAQINVNDYLKIEYSGYDTLGCASYSIAIEEIIQDHKEVFKIKENDESESNFEATLKAIDMLDGAINGDLDKREKLSNSDQIKFTWDNDLEEIEKAYKVKFIYEDVTQEIKDLEIVNKIDPFEEIVVTYEGVAPNGKVVIENNCSNSAIRFECNQSTNVNNGDVITISIVGGEDVYEIAARNGSVPSTLSKDYTVEGLPSYVSELKQIPEDMKEKMNVQAIDAFNAYVAKNWSEAESIEGIECIGNYLLTPKFDVSYGNRNNYLYYIYKVKVNNKENQFAYYYYTYYTDIMILQDGTCSVDLSQYIVPKGAHLVKDVVTGEAFTKGSYWYLGYDQLDSLFNQCITSRIDKYNYESTVEDK